MPFIKAGYECILMSLTLHNDRNEDDSGRVLSKDSGKTQIETQARTWTDSEICRNKTSCLVARSIYRRLSRIAEVTDHDVYLHFDNLMNNSPLSVEVVCK